MKNNEEKQPIMGLPVNSRILNLIANSESKKPLSSAADHYRFWIRFPVNTMRPETLWWSIQSEGFCL